MRLRDMKYIGFKHQRENKQNSDNIWYPFRAIIGNIRLGPPFPAIMADVWTPFPANMDNIYDLSFLPLWIAYDFRFLQSWITYDLRFLCNRG